MGCGPVGKPVQLLLLRQPQGAPPVRPQSIAGNPSMAPQLHQTQHSGSAWASLRWPYCLAASGRWVCMTVSPEEQTLA